jgi:hypothetical protein
MSSNNERDVIAGIIQRAIIFEKTAKAELAKYESSTTRLITLDVTYKELGKLSVKQEELFRQALRCIEQSLFRASHVMAWAGLMDFLEEKLGEDGFVNVSKIRTHWKTKTIDDLRDVGSDFQIIEVVRELGFCTKTEEKALKGLLNKRNECAHPTDYFPNLNESLGYMSEVLKRISTFQKRWSRWELRNKK